MTSGIWQDPYTFREFSETSTAARQELVTEMATRQAAYDWSGMLGLLPDLDPVLAKRGEGAEILDELVGDSHVTAQIQTRKIGTLKREWKFVPGTRGDGQASPVAEKLQKSLKEDLERVDMHNLISQILDAPLYGFTPIEIKWKPGRGRLRISDLEAKPHRWFGFDEHNRPRFKSTASLLDGEELPFGKFVFARHFPTYDNPYGLRLLSRCFWPVTFKKGGIRFWVTFAEKFGMPFLLGYHRPGAERSEKEEMLSNLVRMVRDAVAVVPDGGRVELLAAKGSSGSADIFERLKNAMDGEISKVIVGQTLTAEVGNKGSYAASRTHENVLADYQAADQTLVKTVMEEIARLYGQINAPGVPPPVFKWFEDEDPRHEFAKRDKTLSETGVTFTKLYYQRRYNLADDEFFVSPQGSEDSGKDGATGPGKEEYAEGGEDTDLADTLEAKLGDEADPTVATLVDTIRALVMEASDLAEVRDRLLDLYPDMKVDQMAEAMNLALAGSHVAGGIEVSDGIR